MVFMSRFGRSVGFLSACPVAAADNESAFQWGGPFVTCLGVLSRQIYLAGGIGGGLNVKENRKQKIKIGQNANCVQFHSGKPLPSVQPTKW